MESDGYSVIWLIRCVVRSRDVLHGVTLGQELRICLIPGPGWWNEPTKKTKSRNTKRFIVFLKILKLNLVWVWLEPPMASLLLGGPDTPCDQEGNKKQETSHGSPRGDVAWTTPLRYESHKEEDHAEGA
jgi:hypothetical protein